MVLREGREEAARILARKGADCTQKEKNKLWEKYFDFFKREEERKRIEAEKAEANSAQLKEERKAMEDLKQGR